MEIIADLHIHGKYSRACSKQLNFQNLEKYARLKGVDLLGTGDFTHPGWIKEIKELKEDETGLLKTASGFPFMLTTEISLIYTWNGKGRKVHVVILAPDLESVKQITGYFLSKGRIDYDGRPIFKIPCPQLVEDLRSINKSIEVIPAHVWTPYFGVFGSKGGFDTLQECFEDQTKHIHAIETGLSSDPPMNWRLKNLDKLNLVSFSDLHSYWPWRIGRESTIFNTNLTYKDILKSIRTGENLTGTIEVDPNYGKYHVDGHRNCNIYMEPKDTKKHQGICPKCKKPLTIGVLNRVEELADREEGEKPNSAKPFYSLIPLSEIICTIQKCGVATQKTWKTFYEIMKDTDEFHILKDMPEEELLNRTSKEITEAILKVRKGNIQFIPGYDGEYGVPLFNKPLPKNNIPDPIKPSQTNLGEF